MGGVNVLSAGKALLNRRRQRATVRRSHLLHSASAVVVDRLEERRLFTSSYTWVWGYWTASGWVAKPPAGGDPVQLANGTLTLNTTDLQADGFGTSWGLSRSWSDNPAYLLNDRVGNGWNINQQPQLVRYTPATGVNVIEAVADASSAKWFQSFNGSSYLPWFNTQDTLSYDGPDDLYILTDTQGDQTTFNGFGGTHNGSWGAFDSYQPASGSLISVTSRYSSGDH